MAFQLVLQKGLWNFVNYIAIQAAHLHILKPMLFKKYMHHLFKPENSNAMLNNNCYSNVGNPQPEVQSKFNRNI